ncbi:uncharacterized protein LOC135089417 [Scylla paramamosain]|uniref:uncharacterized protein LOC135089417 n=1 Tax=Scylla paramamosain TaxID=85552 RepID=UPI0030827CCE
MSPRNRVGMVNNGVLCFQLLLLLACSRGGSSSDPTRRDFGPTYSWHCDGPNDGRMIDTSGYPVMLSSSKPGSCVVTDQVFGGCNAAPPQLSRYKGKKEWQNSNNDDIAVYYWCDFGERTSTEKYGLFTYCINGEWTPIDDECLQECNRQRECSELYESNDGAYDICPLKYGSPVRVYCNMNRDLTLVLRIVRGSDSFSLTKSAAQDKQGSLESDYFIGLKNLIGMHWEGDTPIPHDMVIYEKTSSGQTKEWATYNNLFLNGTGFLVSLGDNTGGLGDVVRDIEGKAFCPEDGDECWWGKYSDMQASFCIGCYCC